MKTLLNYLRQCWCEHTLEKEEKEYNINAWDEELEENYHLRNDIRVSLTCLHCGYHKSYWKFNN